MTELGRWLRAQRQARGWPVAEMARQLRQAAKARDGTLPGNDALMRNIRRWERGTSGVSERYKLHYCRAFEIGAEQFGPRRDSSPAGEAAHSPGAALRDLRDSFAEDAKTCQARAEQATGPVWTALCRSQALAYTAAAENLDAVLAGADARWQAPPT
jgi:transcriptional regulator with XRE-family HTH domain